MSIQETVELMSSIEANYCFKHHIQLSDLKNHPEATAEMLKSYINSIKRG
ncbi:MAG: hypothetical protein HUJ61_06095 [Bacilli bacterium]|nr:hypothetical protein [Bacilli bacterium]